MKIPAADSQKNWQRIRTRGESADSTHGRPLPHLSVSLVEIYRCSPDKSMSAPGHKSKSACKQIHVAEEEEDQGRRGANGKIMPPPHSVVIRSASETD